MILNVLRLGKNTTMFCLKFSNDLTFVPKRTHVKFNIASVVKKLMK